MYIQVSMCMYACMHITEQSVPYVRTHLLYVHSTCTYAQRSGGCNARKQASPVCRLPVRTPQKRGSDGSLAGGEHQLTHPLFLLNFFEERLGEISCASSVSYTFVKHVRINDWYFIVGCSFNPFFFFFFF